MRRMGMPVAHPADVLTADEVAGIQNCPTPLTASNPVMSLGDMLWETVSSKTQNKPTTQAVKVSHTGTAGAFTSFEVADTPNDISFKITNTGADLSSVAGSPILDVNGSTVVGKGSNYVNISDTGVVSFAGTAYIDKPITYIEKITVGLTSVQSTNNIPAGANIIHITINIDTAYTAGSTLQLGKSGTLNYILDTTDNNITVINVENYDIFVSWLFSEKLYVTIGGSPTVGSLTIFVEYY